MGEMMERIARALFDAEEDQDPMWCKPWEQVPESGRGRFYESARAVAEAIRQPSEAMVEASYKREHDMGFHGHLAARGLKHSCVWETMIDALLTEGGRTGEGG